MRTRRRRSRPPCGAPPPPPTAPPAARAQTRCSRPHAAIRGAGPAAGSSHSGRGAAWCRTRSATAGGAPLPRTAGARAGSAAHAQDPHRAVAAGSARERHLQRDAAREEHARVAAVGLAGGRVGVRRKVALQHVLRHAEQPLGRHLARPRMPALSPPADACACAHVAVTVAAVAGALVRTALVPGRQAPPGPPDG